LTAADKHFGESSSLPDIQIPISYKSFNSWLPGLLLKKSKGYACVSTDVHGSPETLWVPLQSIRPPKKPTNMSNKPMTAPQRETLEDEQVEQTTHKMSALL
jgi:hypothetical protein